MIRVEFDRHEMASLEKSARERFTPKRTVGVTNRRVDPIGDLMVDRIGLLGEAAVGKLFGIDVIQYWGSFGLAGDEGYDAVIAGWKASIRSSRYPHAGFIIKRSEIPFSCDIGVLVVGCRWEDAVACVSGWLPRFLLDRFKRQEPRLRTDAWYVPPDVFRPIQQLLRLHEEWKNR